MISVEGAQPSDDELAAILGALEASFTAGAPERRGETARSLWRDAMLHPDLELDELRAMRR